MAGKWEPGSGPAPFLRPLLERPRLWLGVVTGGLTLLVVEWVASWFWATADVVHRNNAARLVDDGGATGDIKAIKIAFARWAVIVAVQVAGVVAAVMLGRRRRHKPDV